MRRHLARDAAAVAVSRLGIGAEARGRIPRRGGAGVLKPGTIGADITRGGDDHARRYAHPTRPVAPFQVFSLHEV